ncbi:hypothetical protein TWF694_000185 [Orbilia ellipsospora]|uniref:Extracellular membrane protein CFEM domain-containing protein n=1 Tax=Orbilia ellipsospora TaxID=2528407 RepID=A0AAV9XUJ1_9PEZI
MYHTRMRISGIHLLCLGLFLVHVVSDDWLLTSLFRNGSDCLYFCAYGACPSYCEREIVGPDCCCYSLLQSDDLVNNILNCVNGFDGVGCTAVPGSVFKTIQSICKHVHVTLQTSRPTGTSNQTVHSAVYVSSTQRSSITSSPSSSTTHTITTSPTNAFKTSTVATSTISPNAAPSRNDSDTHSKLSTGAIAGVAVGISIPLLAIIFYVGWRLMRGRAVKIPAIPIHEDAEVVSK